MQDSYTGYMCCPFEDGVCCGENSYFCCKSHETCGDYHVRVEICNALLSGVIVSIICQSTLCNLYSLLLFDYTWYNLKCEHFSAGTRLSKRQVGPSLTHFWWKSWTMSPTNKRKKLVHLLLLWIFGMTVIFFISSRFFKRQHAENYLKK